MSDKRLKSIYIYEYVFGDVEHSGKCETELCDSEQQQTSHISCEWHGDQNPADRPDKDASGHVLVDSDRGTH